jgi:N-acetylglucosaminylphosphatidylinositol deacetylase
MAIGDISKFKKPSADYVLDYITFVQDNIRFILSFIIVTNFLLIFLLKFSIQLKNKFEAFFNKSKETVKETLIIIAHPDDEVMFFLPSIRFLAKNNKKVRIMCLSNGNFNGLGKLREEEFENVCKILKIEDRVLVNNPNLQDDLNKKWDIEDVSQVIKSYLEKDNNIEKIGSIITFDERGVTNHPNHISCCEGFM